MTASVKAPTMSIQALSTALTVSMVFMLAAATPPTTAASDAAASEETASDAVEPQKWRLDLDRSVFAVITHKAGLGARLAHNHLIAADVSSGASLEFSYASDAPEAARFSLETRCDRLRVDDSTLQKRAYPRLEALGILDEPFTDISDKDRAKIRGSMLGKSQLNADRHPTIRAHLASIDKSTDEGGEGDFPYQLQLSLTVAGQEVTKPVRARLAEEGDRLTIEAHGSFAFTDFGIEPYSALLGAVKNDDVFHVYVHVEAEIFDH